MRFVVNPFTSKLDAVGIEGGGGGGAVSSLAADYGSAIPNSAGVITISGGSTGLITTGSGSTITLGGNLNVGSGGTGSISFTAFAPICGGVTSTSPLQSASTGFSTSGYVLTSTGSSSLPSFQDVSASGAIITVDGDSGSATPSSGVITIYSDLAAGNAGASVYFSGSGSTLTYNNTDQYQSVYIGNGSGNLNGGPSLGAAGGGNVGVGLQALGSVSSNSSYTGNNNVGVGYSSGSFITNGNYNTCIGGGAFSGTTGSNNTLIGSGAGSNYTSNEGSNISINSSGTASENNVLRIGQATGTTASYLNKAFICGIYGISPNNSNSPKVILCDNANQLTTVADTTASYVLTSNYPSSPTFKPLSGGGFTWFDTTGGSATLVAQSGYKADASGLTTFTLPTNNALGDTIIIMGSGSGGWKIVYTTNQYIQFGSSATTTTTGNLASTNRYDCCTLVCITASATAPIFQVLSSVGNLAVT